MNCHNYKKLGWLLNVGEEVDCQVQAYIKELREAGTLTLQ